MVKFDSERVREKSGSSANSKSFSNFMYCCSPKLLEKDRESSICELGLKCWVRSRVQSPCFWFGSLLGMRKNPEFSSGLEDTEVAVIGKLQSFFQTR